MSQPAAGQPRVGFVREIAPLLLRRCAGCHGPKIREGGYRLTRFSDLLKPGDSGETPLVPGNPESSELYQRLVAKDQDLRMPQLDDPFTAAEIALIRRWIQEGATFDGTDATTSLVSQLPPRIHPAAPTSYRVPTPVLALGFSPDGRWLAAGGYHEVTFWDPQVGTLLKRISGLPQRVQQLAWSHDSKSLYVAGGTPGEYGEVSQIHMDEEKRVRVLGVFEDIVLSMGLDPDGSRLVAGSAARTTRVIQLESAESPWSARVHSGWVTGVAFSQDGKFVVSASRDQTLKVHDAESGKLFTTYNGHRKQLGEYTGRFAVYDVLFDPQSGQAVSAGEGRAIRVWEPRKAQQENGTAADMEGRFFKKGHTRFIAHGLDQAAFRLALAGDQLFAVGASGARQFEFTSGKPVRTLEGLRDWGYSITASATRDLVAAGCFDGSIRVWKISDGTPVSEFFAAPGYKKQTSTR